ncbi:MAG: GrpB family protein [Bdellovibrionales bacterium]|nr:GrpB family protein [Bdellovibrionales bacterium]
MDDGESTLGLDPERVHLRKYSPSWPTLFLREREQISHVLELGETHIEHIGSTALPGAIAKPIIDILIGIPDNERIGEVSERLETLGYLAKGEQTPGRYFFLRGVPNTTHHLHVVKFGCDEWRECLSFRDALLADSRLLQDYCQLKRELAHQFATERERYTSQKGPFIDSVLLRIKGDKMPPEEKD